MGLREFVEEWTTSRCGGDYCWGEDSPDDLSREGAIGGENICLFHSARRLALLGVEGPPVGYEYFDELVRQRKELEQGCCHEREDGTRVLRDGFRASGSMVTCATCGHSTKTGVMTGSWMGGPWTSTPLPTPGQGGTP